MADGFDNIELEVKLGSRELRDGHGLYAVLHSAIKSRTSLPLTSGHPPQSFWPADDFRLGKVSVFREASEAERQAVLGACGRNLLAESYYIEKCGMYFAAKMSLLSETTQERMLYSLFAADEAVHFNWVAQFIAPEAVAPFLHNPFIKLLEDVLRREDRATLAYVVQVILEGWGIHHYQALAKSCLDANLRTVFEAILKDEARHHGSGLILFNEQNLSDMQLRNIVAVVARLFRLAQTGPQMVVSAIEQAKGRLSKGQKAAIFAELDCEAETAKRLETLKSLIKAASYGDVILKSLDQADAFRPFTASECAAVS